MPTTAHVAGAEVTRYIQSCFKIKTPAAMVWLDPFRVSPDHVGGDKADLVLVTHPHQDHLDIKAITACSKEGTTIVASPAAARKLAQTGITSVALWEGESTTVAGIEVTAVPGYNGLHPRTNQFNVGFRFKLGNSIFYTSGDTDAVPELAEIGPVDVAFLPIGGTFVMDETEAARAVAMVKPGTVVPTHYGFVTKGDPQYLKQLVTEKTEVLALETVLKAQMPALVRFLAKLAGSRRKRWQ